MGQGRACVALARGHSRYDSVAGALRALKNRVDLRDVRSLLIKPNSVGVERQLAATHVDAVRAVLDFVRARYYGPVVVAEGAAVSSTDEGFQRFGYGLLVDECRVELLDLNVDDTGPVRVYDRRWRPLTVYLARTAVEADYRISVGPPKTDDVVVVTLSIKNIVMGRWSPKGYRQQGRHIQCSAVPGSRTGARSVEVFWMGRVGQGNDPGLPLGLK